MSRTYAAVAELEVLAKQFGNQAQLALALDVEKSSVTRWLQGKDKPAGESEERITALRYLAFRLSRIFHPEVANDWLCGINAFLGNQRPMDLIRTGRISEVIAAIEQTDAGSYA
jgi:transcriptional regulator with XRE-family HTH domain